MFDHKEYTEGPGDVKLHGIYLGPSSSDGTELYNMFVDLANDMGADSLSAAFRQLVEEAYQRLQVRKTGGIMPSIEELPQPGRPTKRHKKG